MPIHSSNALYAASGLWPVRWALTFGAVLAVWSAASDEAFTRRLTRCGLDATARTIRRGRTCRGEGVYDLDRG